MLLLLLLLLLWWGLDRWVVMKRVSRGRLLLLCRCVRRPTISSIRAGAMDNRVQL